MIAITTSSSISVNPRRFLVIDELSLINGIRLYFRIELSSTVVLSSSSAYSNDELTWFV
jgi:hypothetical protein